MWQTKNRSLRFTNAMIDYRYLLRSIVLNILSNEVSNHTISWVGTYWVISALIQSTFEVWYKNVNVSSWSLLIHNIVANVQLWHFWFPFKHIYFFFLSFSMFSDHCEDSEEQVCVCLRLSYVCVWFSGNINIHKHNDNEAMKHIIINLGGLLLLT